MLHTNNTSIFTVDKADSSLCLGWYVRLDDRDTAIFVTRNNKQIRIYPQHRRQDVVEAGFSKNPICGFTIEFNPPLKYGETAVFHDSYGVELFKYRGANPGDQPSVKNYQLMENVGAIPSREAMLERQKLLTQSLYKECRDMLRDMLKGREGEELVNTLAEILAEIKTSQTLMLSLYDASGSPSAASRKHLKTSLNPAECLCVEMSGEINGSNWLAPEANGRWMAGTASTVILPKCLEGSYSSDIEISEISPAVDLNFLRVMIDGVPVAFHLTKSEPPFHLHGLFESHWSSSPFSTLSFQYIAPEDSGLMPPTCEPLIKVSKITLARQA